MATALSLGKRAGAVYYTDELCKRLDILQCLTIIMQQLLKATISHLQWALKFVEFVCFIVICWLENK